MHAGESAVTKKFMLAGNRQQVRNQTIVYALQTLAKLAA
jgi:nicotinamide mononucleotide (NMN) deamidase PncC